ncbi:MAG TPA: hypothetical protein VLM89_13120 [Phycisphaerae bacterium]|nr:hypothetical protein [Phycisphaerae bacterium]
MGSFSNYWENEILDHVFGKGSYTPPTIHVGLCSADPTDAGTGSSCNELSGNGYARVETSAASWDTASGGALSNAAAVTFPQASGEWTAATHFALFDAPTGGNMLAHGSLSASKTVQIGDTASFAIGALDVSLD